MRFTLRLSPSLTSAGDPRFRLRFLLFDVRMWRRCDRPRFTFPVPVNLKRLAAPLWVFSFGIVPQNSHQLSAKVHSRGMSDDRSDQTCHSERSEPCYDTGLATCAAGALGALCAAALCFSFSRSFSVFLGAKIA